MLCRTRTRSYRGVCLCCRHWGGTEVGRSLCLCRRHSLGARLSCTAENYGTTSGNECVRYIARAGFTVWETDRQRYIIIRSTAPYSAARETTTSVGLAHARPIILKKHFMQRVATKWCSTISRTDTVPWSSATYTAVPPVPAAQPTSS